MQPGILQVSAEQYHADDLGADTPMLSASIATILLRESPKHAHAAHPKLGGHPSESKEEFDLGTAAHSMILEGSEAHYRIIDAEDWRTKEARIFRDVARAEGKTPLLTKQLERVRFMSAAVRAQFAEFADAPAPLTAGKPEQTLVWREGEIWCKARLDWLHDDLLTIDDLKTGAVSAEPNAWTRTIYGRGGDVQAAFYLRGLAAVKGKAYRIAQFRWIVVENRYPYAVSVCTLSPDDLARAHRKVQVAIDTWAECLHQNYWPGYPLRTATLTAPSFLAEQWDMQENPF